MYKKKSRQQRSHSSRHNSARLKPLSSAILLALGPSVALAANNTITLHHGSASRGGTTYGNLATATSLDIRGNITDIRTGTVRGNTGFNSFARFEVAAGKTVNLHVPDVASNLVNLVHDARAEINGTLNGLKDGRIGGNIIFADPHGLVVGGSGVINVGSLVVTTPNAAAMEQLLLAATTDVVSDAEAADLIVRLQRGELPNAENGTITVEGRVNSRGAISLFAASALVAEGARLESGTDAARAVFERTVNTDGLPLASGIERADGGIAIVADGDIEMNGALAALMADDGGAGVAIEAGDRALVAGTIDVSSDQKIGGQVRITAADSVVLAEGARIDASGFSGGGHVVVGGDAVDSAARQTSIAEGAVVTADAANSGDGGSVYAIGQERLDFAGHLSARGGAEGGDGGFVEVSSRDGLHFGGTIDLLADAGRGGRLLIDPYDLTIVEDAAATGGANEMTVGAIQALGDVEIDLWAENTLTVGSADGTAATDLDLSGTMTTGSLTLRSGLSDHAGNVVFNEGSRVRTGGGDVNVYAGTGFENAAAIEGNVTLGRIDTDGGSVAVKARQSITLPTGVVINTRNVAAGLSADLDTTASEGASGAIALEAPNIDLATGSKLLAFSTDPAHVAGDVTLNAVAREEKLDILTADLLSAVATITLDGTIDAGTVRVQASAEAERTLSDGFFDTATADSFLLSTVDLPLSALPIEVVYVQADASADITIGGNAHIAAAGALTVDAWAAQTVSLPKIDVFGIKSPVGVDLVAGRVSGGASAQVQGGAQISAGGVDIRARNAAKLSVSSLITSTEDGLQAAAAFGIADITTRAKVADGSRIDAGGGVLKVAALSRNDLSTSATAMALAEGRLGLAASVLLPTINTSARLGGKVSNVDDVAVAADTFFDTMSATSSTTTGSGYVIRKVLKGAPAGYAKVKDYVSNLRKKGESDVTGASVSEKDKTAPTSADSADTSQPKLASATTITISDVSTEAYIADGARIGSVTDADGSPDDVAADVRVSARTAYQSMNPDDIVDGDIFTTLGKGLHNTASSGVESVAKEEATEANPSGDVTLSAAIALGWYENDARAWIGKGATVVAESVAVDAEVDVPISITYLNFGKWDEVDSLFGDLSTIAGNISGAVLNLTGKANTGFGLLGPQVFTSFAKATGQGTDLAISGAANLFFQSNTAEAFIDEGAQVVATGPVAGEVGVPVANNLEAHLYRYRTITGGDAVSVAARSSAHSLNGAGNISMLLSGTGSEEGVSVGTGFSLVHAANTADAWIARGASIESAGDLAVTALGDDLVINLAPSAGMGMLGKSSGPFAANGTFAISALHNTASASISNAAHVNLQGDLLLDAHQNVGLWSMAGSVNRTTAGGVGVGIAVNWLDAETSAYIGDNSAKLESETGQSQCGEADQPDCAITANSADIDATTEGQVMALGLAGSVTDGGGSDEGGLKEALKAAVGSAWDAAKTKVSDWQNSGKTADAATVDPQGVLNAPSGAVGNIDSLVAGLNGLPLGELDDPAGAIAAKVESDFKGDDTDTENPAENPAEKAAENASGANAQGGQESKFSLTASGSVAANLNLGRTEAAVEGAVLNLGGGLDVSAQQRTVTFAGAGSAAWRRESSGDAESGDSSYQAGVAGAFGFNLLADRVAARVDQSTITLNGTDPLNVEALRGGMAGAVGAGTVIADGADVTVTPSASVTVGVAETEATVVDSTITSGGGAVDVLAYDHMNVASGGGSLYKGGEKAGIGGAVSLNLLVNQTRAGLLASTVTGAGDLKVEARSPARIIASAAVAGLGSEGQKANMAGAFVVNNIVNSTVAEIGNGSVVKAASVTVAAQDDDDDSLDARLGDLGDAVGDTLWALNEGFDLTGASLPSFDTSSIGDAELANDEKFSALGRTPNIATPTTGADAGGSILGVTGVFQQNSAKMSGGLSVAYNGIYSDYRAELADAEVETAGNVTVQAENDGRIYALSAGLGVQSGGQFGAMGSAAINVIASRTEALLGKSGNTTTVGGADGSAAGRVNLIAGDSREIFSAAGNILASGSQLSLAIGGGVNVAYGAVAAKVQDVDVSAGTLTVGADSATGIASLAASAGTFNLNLDLGSTEALIAGSTLALGSGGLDLVASDASALWGGAGGAAIGREGAALGLAAAINLTHHETTARLSDTALDAPGADVTVAAERTGFAAAGAVAGVYSSGIAGGISVAANVLASKVTAEADGIYGSSTGAAAMDSLTVDAMDSADTWALGGQAAISSGSLGAGGAVTLGWSDATVSALVRNSVLDVADAVTVEADTGGFGASLGVAIGGSGSVAFGGVLSVNGINNAVTAGIENAEQRGALADTAIRAADASAIWAAAVGLAGSGTAAAGFALAGNGIGTDVHAYLHGDGTAAAPAYRGNDVTVNAESTGAIHSLAIGGAAAGQFAAAGSIVVNALTGSTVAEIAEGALVRAIDDVVVGALASRQVYTLAGSGAFSLGFGAAGLSAAVNVMDDRVEARIAGPHTRVTALGYDDADGLKVATGGLDSGIAMNAALEETATDDSSGEADRGFEAQQQALADSLTNFQPTPELEDFNGLAVNALSLQQAHTAAGAVTVSLDPTSIVKLVGGVIAGAPSGGTSLVAAFVGSGSGVALNAGVNVMGGTTAAYIDRARINDVAQLSVGADSYSAAASQRVDVNAASHQVLGSVTAAVSGGSAASVAGAVAVNIIDRTTESYVRASDVTARSAFGVNARGSVAAGSASAGLSGALLGLGVGGTAVVNVIDATVTAEASGGTFRAGSLNVTAEHDAAVASAVGVLAGGLLGAGVLPTAVTVSSSTVGASLGVDGQTTTIDTAGAVTVAADSEVALLDIVAGMAVGGGLGGAGSVAVNVMGDATTAQMADATFEQAASRVDVVAHSALDIHSYVGSVGLGFAGANGMAVNAGVLRSTTRAGIVDSSVKTGDLAVRATTDRDIDLITLGVGASTQQALAGSIGIVVAGAVDTGDNGDSGFATAWNATGGARGESDRVVAEARAETGREDDAAPTATVGADSVIAAVTGGSVDASGTVTVSAVDDTAVDNLSGGVGIGVTNLGVGAGLAYSQSASQTAVTMNSNVVNAADLALSASVKGARDALAFAGGAGAVGLGAAVAHSKVANGVSAALGGTVNTSGGVSVAASDESSLDVDGYGASIGAAAAGVVIAVAERATQLSAAGSGSITAGDGLSVSALGGGSVDATSMGASAGIGLSAIGSLAVASDNTSVSATVGNGAQLAADLALLAGSDATVSATAQGAALSGGHAMGASIARAGAARTISGAVGNNVTVASGHSATITARQSVGDEPAVKAQSFSAAGGGLIGAEASWARVDNGSTVTAGTGSGFKMSGGGDLKIAADSRSHQQAEANGLSVGGLLGVGLAKAEAYGTTETKVRLGDDADLQLNSLTLHNTSDQFNDAVAFAGSGGVVAGNAVITRTGAHDTVSTAIGTGADITALSVDIGSHYLGQYGGHANSVNAGVMEMSGAFSENRVDADHTLSIGDQAGISALGQLRVAANSALKSRHKDNEAASAAGGGVASGQAASHLSDHEVATAVSIGAGASLFSASDLSLLAVTDNHATENVVLATGAGIAETGALNSHQAALGNSISVGSGATLESLRDLNINTYTNSNVANDASARLWAGVGHSDANARTEIRDSQTVAIGQDAQLHAKRYLSIAPGVSATGAHANNLYTLTTANSMTKGLLTLADAHAEAVQSSTVTLDIAQGALLTAARDVELRANRGSVQATVAGKSTASVAGVVPINDESSSTDLDRSSAITIDGTVLAGRYNNLEVVITEAGHQVNDDALAPIIEYLTFNPSEYVEATGSGMSVLESAMPDRDVAAVRVSELFASGGDVILHADNIDGSGSVTAQGSPTITLDNQSERFLILGDANAGFAAAHIPDELGGSVKFTGGADTVGGISLAQVGADGASEITITNAYADDLAGEEYGPSVFQEGAIRNESGFIHIRVANGGFGGYASTSGRQVLVEVPEGPVEFYRPNGYWSPGLRVENTWKDYADISNDVFDAVIYAANAEYGTDLYWNNANLLYRGPVDNDEDGSSIIVFGSCRPANVTGPCTSSEASQYTGIYTTGFNGMSGSGEDQAHIAIIPVRDLYRYASSFGASGIGEDEASHLITGEAVGIKAKYIDINGTIKTGRETDRSLSVSASLSDWVAEKKRFGATGVVEIPKVYSKVNLATGTASFVGLLDAPDGELIEASFDFANDQIIVDDVNASGGGYLYMEGQIISSSPYGNIEVESGYGNVSIDNRSDYQLVTNRVDTGAGNVGMVHMVDKLKNQTVWYRYTLGEGLEKFVASGTDGRTIDDAQQVSTNGNSDSFSPKSGVRWKWKHTASFSRSWDEDEENFTEWTWRGDQHDPWTRSEGWLVQGSTSDPVYEQQISGNVYSYNSKNIAYHGCGDSIGSDCHWDFKASRWDSEDKEYESIWRYRFPTRGDLTYTHSAKADYRIGISFAGHDEGRIDIDSPNDVLLNGDLKNISGLTTVTSGRDILSDGSAQIDGKDVTLSAARRIGEAARSIDLTLQEGGRLNAASGSGGIYLNLDSGAVLERIDAGGVGDIVIAAHGDLLGGANGNSLLRGRDITLSSRTGSVGALDNPINLEAVERVFGGQLQGGVVNVTANRDIALTDSYGDLWVDRVISNSGSVRLEAVNGSIRDNARREASSTLDETQQREIWQRLSLTSQYGAEEYAKNRTVPAFERQVEQNYREYWQLLELGSVSGDAYTLNADGLALYQTILESRTGKAVDASTAQAYAQERYTAVTAAFETNLGSEWFGTAPFQGYQADYSYTATAEQVAELTRDSVWTESELMYGVDITALEPATGAPVGSAEPNVSGRDIALIAGQGIGELAAPINITYADLVAGNLTQEQASALALAAAPGDVTLNTDADGKILSLDVKRTIPFYVDPLGRFDSRVGGSAFLQASSNLRVGEIAVDGNAQITAANSILAATGSPAILTVGGDLQLLAGSGDIGDAVNGAPVNLAVGGDLAYAASGGDIALRWLDGDFRIGAVVAPGTVRLEAPSGGLYGVSDGVNVRGGDIVLQVRDAVGSADEALTIDLTGVDGSLAGRIGSGYLYSDAAVAIGNLASDGRFNLETLQALSVVDAVTVGGDLDLTARSFTVAADQRLDGAGGALIYTDEDLILAENAVLAIQGLVDVTARAVTLGEGSQWAVGSLLASTGRLAFAADAALNASGDTDVSAAELAMAAGARFTTGGNLGLTTTGDMQTGRLHSDSGQFDLAAGGRVFGNGDGQTNLTADQAGTSTLVAAGDIGTIDDPLRFGIIRFDRIESTGGSVYLHGASDFAADSVRSAEGDVVVTSPLHVAIDELYAKTGLDARTTSLQIGRAIVEGAALFETDGGDMVVGYAESAGSSRFVTRNANLSVTEAIAGTTIDFAVNGGDMAVQHAESTGDARFTATDGDLSVTNAISAATIDFLADGGNITVRHAEADTAMRLDNRSAGGGDITFGYPEDPGLAAADFDLLSHGTLAITATRNIYGGNAYAVANVELQSGGMELGRIESAADVWVTASADMAAAGLQAGGRVDVQATGHAAIGELISTDRFDVVAGSLAVDAAHSGSTATFIANAGDMTVRHAESAGDMLLDNRTAPRGDITFGYPEDPARTSDQMDLITQANLTLKATGDITGGSAQSAQRMEVEGYNITFGKLESLYADLLATAEWNLTGVNATAGRDLGIVVGNQMIMEEVDYGGELSLDAGRDLIVGAGRSIDIDSHIEAGRDIIMRSGGSIRLAGAKAGRDAFFTADGDIDILEAVKVGRDLVLDSTGDINAGTYLSAGEDLQVQAIGTLRAQSLYAGASMDVITGGSLHLQEALAGTSAAIRVGTVDGVTFDPASSMAIGRLAGTDILLRSGNSVAIDQVRSSSGLEITSQQITIGQGENSGNAPLYFRVRGTQKAEADRVSASFDTAALVSEWLHAADTRLAISGERVMLKDVRFAELLDLTTAKARMIADNLSPAFRGEANVQLHELDKAFWLNQEGVNTYTNAYVVHRDAEHFVEVVNFSEEHDRDGTIDYESTSAERYTDRYMQLLELPKPLLLSTVGVGRAIPLYHGDLSQIVNLDGVPFQRFFSREEEL